MRGVRKTVMHRMGMGMGRVRKSYGQDIENGELRKSYGQDIENGELRKQLWTGY